MNVKDELLQRGIEIFNEYGDLSRDEFLDLDCDRRSKRKITENFGGWSEYKDACLGRYEKNVDTIEREEDKKSLCVTTKSKRIKTLDDLIEYAEIDTDKWEVERFRVKKWEMGVKDRQGELTFNDGKITGNVAYGRKPVIEPMYSVEARFVLKFTEGENFLREDIQKVLDEIKEFSPKPFFINKKNIKEELMYEISIMDLHMAKLGWHEEVGADYDLDIAEELYKRAVEDLIHKAEGFDISKIILPTGNDLFHVDNWINETTRGTQQDVDSRWQKAFRRARQLITESIYLLSQVAPVVVPMVPGNHDMERVFYLGEVLDSVFYDNPYVTIDNSPNPRKYYNYGVNLLGFTHGSDEKIANLPLIMAREAKEEWAKSEVFAWHIGHVHKKKQYNYVAGDTFNGVVVRVIPSLCSVDAWHHHKGFVKGFRAAESFLWDYSDGYIGHFSTNLIKD